MSQGVVVSVEGDCISSKAQPSTRQDVRAASSFSCLEV